MKILNNCIVTDSGIYKENGSLLINSQRISFDHQVDYWKASLIDVVPYIDINEIEIYKELDEAFYVGRFSRHLGHTIMEGFPYLLQAVDVDVPLLGRIVKGNIPKQKLSGVVPQKDMEWIIRKLSPSAKYIQMLSKKHYFVKRLFVPERAYDLSLSAEKPYLVKEGILRLVENAREEYPTGNIDNLYLARSKEDSSVFINNPIDAPIGKQISLISNSNNLYGFIGSNTHLSIFADWSTVTHWDNSRKFFEAVRNQCICDLIKSYNDYKKNK